MSVESTISRKRAPADTPLLTLGDVEEWQGELRALKHKRDEFLRGAATIDVQIAALEQKLKFVEPLVSALASSKIEADAPQNQLLLTPDENGWTSGIRSMPTRRMSPRHINVRARPGPKDSTAYTCLRDIALRLGREKPEGFAPLEVTKIFFDDETIPADVKEVRPSYIYNVLKRMRFEGLVERRGTKRDDNFFLTNNQNSNSIPASGGVPDGFKLVPLTKEERIRRESRQFLQRKKDRTAHRAQIADHLKEVGIMGTEKNTIGNVSIYFGRWPEFVADGNGNYSLDMSRINDNGDP